MKSSLKYASAALAALVTTFVAVRARAACTGYDIVVLAGQSNAVGRGLTGTWSFTPAQIAARPRVFQTVRSYDANTDPIWTYLTPSTFQIVPASEPLLNDSNLGGVAGRIGFTYSFSLLLASQQTDPNRCVLIVPAARSGTSVLEWNLIDRQFAGDLAFFYRDMISRVKLGLLLLPNSRVAAFLWLQGEMDALTISSIDTPMPLRETPLMPNVATFASQLQTVMAQMRTDLGCVPTMLGNLSPSFIADFSSDPATEANAQMVKGQVEAAIKMVANNDSCKKMAVIDSSGLLTNAQQAVTNGYQDFTHFSATSQITLSNRFFREYKVLTK